MRLDDYTLPDTEMNVTCDTPLPSDDISGEASGTDKSFKGIKAKILNVTFTLQFERKDELKTFVAFAESLDENGDLIPRTIVHDTADVLGINQVTFHERHKVSEIPDFKAWKVNFKLQEYISPAEKNAAKQDTTTVQTGQSSEGEKTVEAPDATPEEIIQRQLTSFEEKVLKVADRWSKKINATVSDAFGDEEKTETQEQPKT